MSIHRRGVARGTLSSMAIRTKSSIIPGKNILRTTYGVNSADGGTNDATRDAQAAARYCEALHPALAFDPLQLLFDPSGRDGPHASSRYRGHSRRRRDLSFAAVQEMVCDLPESQSRDCDHL